MSSGRHALNLLRQRLALSGGVAAALAAGSILLHTPNAGAQTTRPPASIIALAPNDAALATQLQFHAGTALGAADISALSARRISVCAATPADLPGVFSALTTRDICANGHSPRGHRIAINQSLLQAETTAVARAILPRNGNAAQLATLERQALSVLTSLVITNEAAGALQIQSGVMQRTNSLRDSRPRDHAAAYIALEMASDARMVLQADALITQHGFSPALVTRVLDSLLPRGDGGALLDILASGRDQPDYNQNTQMAAALARLWNANSENPLTANRVNHYLRRAWQYSDAPIPLAMPRASTLALIGAIAPTRGLSSFDADLQTLAVRVSGNQPQLAGLRPQLGGSRLTTRAPF